jgi:hypothetical protein
MHDIAAGMKFLPFLEHCQNYPNVASIFHAVLSGDDMIYDHVGVMVVRNVARCYVSTSNSSAPT